MRRERALLLTVGVLTLGVLVAPSTAQRRVQDGRALDNNLQQGSGGVNAPRQRNTRGQYQDAIITGNVGGLQRFRGGIDYRAPGEFSADTAADDTFDFRRRSLPSGSYTRSGPRSQPWLNARNNPLVNPNARGGRGLLRAGSGVRAGQLTGQAPRHGDALRLYREDTIAGSIDRPEQVGASIDQRLSGSRDYAPGLGDTLGVRRTEEGMIERLRASPLFGVRRDVLVPLATEEEDSPTAGQPPADEPEGATAPSQTERPRDEEAEPEPANPAKITGARIEGRQQARIEQRLTGRLEAKLNGTAALRGPGLMRAEQAARDETAEADTQRRAGLLGSRSVQPGEDPYADLLRRIREDAERRGVAAPPADQLTGRASEPQRDTEPDGIPEDRLARDPASQQQEPGRPQTRIEKIAEQFRQAQRKADRQQMSESVDRLVKQLDHDLAPMSSMAGSGQGAVNRLMSEAEQKMKQQRYFEAERYYRRALSLRPGYPLAMVGRAHAQLGAGLFVAAARNLRDVLSRNPEMIATRYSQPLLPPTERISGIRDQLRQMSAASDRPMASLLRAYLAYQQGRTEALKEALKAMDETQPDDPLPQMLRPIWLPGEQQETDEAKDAETSSAAQDETESDGGDDTSAE